MILAATAWGIAIALFGLVTTPAVALLFLAIAGGADAVSGIFRSTIWNQTVPDALRLGLALSSPMSLTSRIISSSASIPVFCRADTSTVTV